MQEIKTGKKIVTILLVLSCVISGIILAASPSYKIYAIESNRQLDSLINLHLQNARILPQQMQVSHIIIDSTFARKEYRVEVPSRFSKTLFHAALDKDLYRYNISAPAKVHFPSRDMDIYIYNKGTVLRTIRLTTDPDLDSLYTGEQ
jgi:hypothetical protein